MRARGVIAVVALVAFVATLSACTPPVGGPSGGCDPKTSKLPCPPSYYLAVGDSVPVWNGDHSYPNLILQSSVTRNVANPQLENLACSSETSGSFLVNSVCGGSQQDKAVAFLKAHRGHIALITIDIGGNDVVFCADATGINWDCALPALAQLEKNLQTILDGLRSAAGPGVPIVGMNYYDPYLGNWLLGDAAHSAVVNTVGAATIVNSLLERVYAKNGVQVANVQDAFHTTDLTTIVHSQWGDVPIAVERACTLLDITCRAGQLEGFGDDPNDAGAAVIANAFEDVIGVLPAS